MYKSNTHFKVIKFSLLTDVSQRKTSLFLRRESFSAASTCLDKVLKYLEYKMQ